MSKKPFRLSKAQARVMAKAANPKGVMAAGGFGGQLDESAILTPGFDKACIIERLMNKGLLTAGDFVNQYVHTDAGRAYWNGGDQ